MRINKKIYELSHMGKEYVIEIKFKTGIRNYSISKVDGKSTDVLYEFNIGTTNDDIDIRVCTHLINIYEGCVGVS